MPANAETISASDASVDDPTAGYEVRPTRSSARMNRRVSTGDRGENASDPEAKRLMVDIAGPFE